MGSQLLGMLLKNYRISVLEKDVTQVRRLKPFLSDINYFSLDQAPWDEIFQDPVDIIIHTATLYGKNSETWKAIYEANLAMPIELLDQALQHKVKTFINTDTILDRQTSLYALTKKQFKDWLSYLSTDLDVINLELEHFYGPGAPPTNFVTLMVQKMLRDEKTIDLTEGKQQRDFVYINDLLDVYRLIIENISSITGFRNIQVGTGHPHELCQVIEEIKQLTSSHSELKFGALPYRVNEVMVSETRPETLFQLGWTPKTSLQEGLRSVVEYEKRKLK